MSVHSLRAMTADCAPALHCAELSRQVGGPVLRAVLRGVLHSLSTLWTPFAMGRNLGGALQKEIRLCRRPSFAHALNDRWAVSGSRGRTTRSTPRRPSQIFEEKT